MTRFRWAAVRDALKHHWTALFVLPLAGVALWQIVYSKTEHARLVAQVASLEQAASSSAPLAEGESLLSVTGVTLAGKYTNIPLRFNAGKPSLIFGIASSCVASDRSFDAFKRLAKRAEDDGLRVVFVGRDPFGVWRHSPFALLEWPLIIEPTYATYRALHLGMVPQVALVSEEGVIRRAWAGQVTPDQESEMLDAIAAVGRGGNP